MVTTETFATVEEYLATSYSDGDREFVDGRVLERKLGEKSHSRTQGNVYYYLRSHYSGVIWAAPEIRVQVRETRFRVPDVVVVSGAEPNEEILASPPLIAIEILSKDDRAEDLQEKIEDYLDFGIAYVWVLNPRTRTATSYRRNEVLTVHDGALRTSGPDIIVPLAEIF